MDGVVVEASGLISSKRHLVLVAREREEGYGKQEFMENEQLLIRQEHEQQKEQISKLLENIRSEISNRPARTDSAFHVSVASFPTSGNSGYPLHNSTPIEAYPGLKGPPKLPIFSGTDHTSE